MSDQITVFTHGDDPISQAGLLAQLRGRPDVHLVETLDSGDRVDVGLLSVGAIDDESLRMVRSMRHSACEAVVVVATDVDEQSALHAAEEGAVGVLRRSDATTDRLTRVIASVGCGGGEMPRDLLGGLLRQVNRVHERVLAPKGLTFASLSERETAVLRLVSDGMDTRQIASTLSYSERTIKNVIQDVVRRFGLRNRCHAVSFAIRQGLI